MLIEIEIKEFPEGDHNFKRLPRLKGSAFRLRVETEIISQKDFFVTPLLSPPGTLAITLFRLNEKFHIKHTPNLNNKHFFLFSNLSHKILCQ